MPDGKSFNALAVRDDKGVEHVIYFRLLKPHLQFGKVQELAGQNIRVTGERTQAGTNSVFNSVDAVEKVP